MPATLPSRKERKGSKLIPNVETLKFLDIGISEFIFMKQTIKQHASYHIYNNRTKAGDSLLDTPICGSKFVLGLFRIDNRSRNLITPKIGWRK